ncbi:MAG: peptidoglycan-binding protein LysM [Thermoanaerobaculia bacterium]|nr:peptidoglycan-binding protein LysM [Thermoanaerobaculia bacterium]
MGLLDFVKDAGAKMLGREEKRAPEVRETRPPTPEEVQAYHNRRRAKALYEAVTGHGLPTDELAVEVDGEVAILRGKVPTQEAREKIVLAVGNTAGIAAVNYDELEVEKQEPEAVYHTVQPGESLSKIAKQHYGNAMKYPVIFEANKPMLTDPDKIYPGQVLRIPPLGE